MKERRAATFTIYLLLFVVCVFSVMPFAWALLTSLKPLDEVYVFPPSFRLDAPRWSNYTEAFQRLPVARFLLNSLLITTTSVCGAVLTASMAGFALACGRFRTRRFCFLLVLLSLMIPAQVLIVPRFLLFDQLGWINTYKPLIVPAWLGGGAFNIFLFRQFFASVPRSFEDAARLEGAGAWQIYWHVLLPMVRPATVTAALLSFVYHWQAFLDPLLYLSDFTTFPISLGLRMYQSQAGAWANLLMAASLIALIPVVIVFLVCQKSLMAGLGAIGPRKTEIASGSGNPRVPESTQMFSIKRDGNILIAGTRKK